MRNLYKIIYLDQAKIKAAYISEKSKSKAIESLCSKLSIAKNDIVNIEFYANIKNNTTKENKININQNETERIEESSKNSANVSNEKENETDEAKNISVAKDLPSQKTSSNTEQNQNNFRIIIAGLVLLSVIVIVIKIFSNNAESDKTNFSVSKQNAANIQNKKSTANTSSSNLQSNKIVKNISQEEEEDLRQKIRRLEERIEYLEGRTKNNLSKIDMQTNKNTVSSSKEILQKSQERTGNKNRFSTTISFKPAYETAHASLSFTNSASNQKKIEWITPSKRICNSGIDGDDGECISEWDDTIDICKRANGRLPTIDELKSVVMNCGGDLIISDDVDAYDNKKNLLNDRYQRCYKKVGFLPEMYWSSAKSGDRVSSIEFQHGILSHEDIHEESNLVRCVALDSKSASSISDKEHDVKKLKKSNNAQITYIDKKVDGISYKLKKIKAKKCANSGVCVEIEIGYPVEIDTGNSSTTRTIQNIINKLKPDFDPDDMPSYTKFVGSDPFSYGLNLDYHVYLDIVSTTKDTFSICKNEGGYTGGAHDTTIGDEYMNYRFDNGVAIYIQDIIDDIPLLTTISEKYFRKVNNISSITPLKTLGLFENNFKLPKNFYIADDGLHFSYQAYEVAPYGATGGYTGSFVVPFKEISHIIKRDGILSQYASKTNDNIGEFLSEYLSSGNTDKNLEEKIERYFASSVNPYYSIKSASKWDIIKDKRRYFQRWPSRHFAMTDYKILDEYEQNGDKYYKVQLELDWQVSSPKQGDRNGHSIIEVVLRQISGGYKIAGLRNIDIQKKQIYIDNEEDEENLYEYPTYGRSEDTITLRSNLISIKLHYKKMGNKIKFDISATNHVGYGKGGVTLSFPSVYYGSIVKYINNTNFETTKTYPAGSLIWNKNYHRKMPSEYLMIEGWASKWTRGATKHFTFVVEPRNGYRGLMVQFRVVLIRNAREYAIPDSEFGYEDQQGYSVSRITIEI